MTDNALEILNVSKRFGATLANDDITLTLAKGEVLALLGENGAGKTTLMNILFGHYTPDQGRIRVMGADLPAGRPRATIRAGVGMVHQHFSLAPNLSVLENVMTGSESLWRWRSDVRRGRARLIELSERFGLKAEPEARLGDLEVGERQRVEILKALYNDARILILDEPTAVLTTQESERLFKTLKVMAGQGLSIIFISHKLDEVMSAADRVVVLRRGRSIAERRTVDTSKAELAELMVGHAVQRPQRAPATPGPVVLEAVGLGLRADGAQKLQSVSFRLRAGEVVGIIGVSGNGQAALARVLGGTAARSEGDLMLFGQPVGALTVPEVVAMGIGRIPEDRNRDGVIGDMTVWENTVLERIARYSRRGLVDRRAAIAQAGAVIQAFDVRGSTPTGRIRALSGGNIQKLILGRNLIERPRILIAAQPARGLDEGAVAQVHARILKARAEGTAILLISEDLEEIMQLSDRIHAIVAGRLSPPIAAAQADARLLGLMMAGVWDGVAEAPDHAF